MPPVLKTIDLLLVVLVRAEENVLAITSSSYLMHIISFAEKDVLKDIEFCIEEHYAHIVLCSNFPFFLALELTFLTAETNNKIISNLKNPTYSSRAISLSIPRYINWMKCFLCKLKTIFFPFIYIDRAYMSILWPSISKRKIVELVPIVDKLLLNTV